MAKTESIKSWAERRAARGNDKLTAVRYALDAATLFVTTQSDAYAGLECVCFGGPDLSDNQGSEFMVYVGYDPSV